MTSNYAPRLPAPVYFRRGQHGGLSFVDLVAERTQVIAKKLVELLAAEPETISKNELIYQTRGKAIADNVKENVAGFSRAKDLNDAVAYALEAGWLKVERQTGVGHRGKELLVPVMPTPVPSPTPMLAPRAMPTQKPTLKVPSRPTPKVKQ